MNKRFHLFIGAITLLGAALGVAEEAPPDVDTIVQRAERTAYYAGDDGKATVHMSITDNQGRERTRDFTILRMDEADGGDQYFYVYFKGPADVRKMVFMVWKHVDRDDERWLYLPALDLVKRIAASDKRTSFVGSDFLYEDVSGRSADLDEHVLEKTTDTQYVMLNTPRDAASVEFASYRVWIDRTTFMPMRAEYYNAAGDVYRTVTALKVETIEGHPTILRSEVKNLETGSTTVLTFSDIDYDIGLDRNTFTERYLRRPPREAR